MKSYDIILLGIVGAAMGSALVTMALFAGAQIFGAI